MEVKIKRLHPDAVIPKYAMAGDACLDLTAVSREPDIDNNIVYGTGLAFEIPDGYVGLLFPRSSNAKLSLLLSNSVGVLDAGYRGEVTFKYRCTASGGRCYAVGDRIGQMLIIPRPHVDFVEVDELSESERGIGGYGSTGQ